MVSHRKSVNTVFFDLLQKDPALANDFGHHFESVIGLFAFEVEKRKFHVDWNHGDVIQVENAAGTVAVAGRQKEVLEFVALLQQLRLRLQKLLFVDTLN
jgi:hypothetical protein